jgi:adenylate cyclase
MSFVLVLLVLLLLAGLPLAVWLDLRDLADTNLRRQAADLNTVISSMREYYATNIVGRVLALPGTTKVVHNYRDIPGAIPIPATLSLELGKVISERQQNIAYRFVSDYPFKNRPAHDATSYCKLERPMAEQWD